MKPRNKNKEESANKVIKKLENKPYGDSVVEKTQKSIYFDIEIADKVEIICLQNKLAHKRNKNLTGPISFSSAVNVALKEWLEKQEKE